MTSAIGRSRRMTRSVYQEGLGYSLRMNENSILIRTLTGFPLSVPGANRHSRAV